MVKSIKSSTLAGAAFAFFSLLLLIGNVYFVKSLAIFGSPLLFAVGIFVELALLTVFLYSAIKTLKTPIRIIISIAESALDGMLTNKYIKQFRSSHRALSKWIAARGDTKNPLGLYLTLGVSASLLFFAMFSNILQNVLSHGYLTQIDTRIINLMPTIRTPLQIAFFRFVTFTDNGESILLLVVLASAILWRSRQRVAALLFAAALVLEEAVSFVPKQLVRRMRPDRALSLYTQGAFSFPSGHVVRATILSGLLAYMLFRSFKSALARFFIVFGYVTSVVLVALSRVYLGVHYPSDVMASVFIGGAFLTMLITGIEIISRYHLWGQTEKMFRTKRLIIVPPIIVLVSVVVSPLLIHLAAVNRVQKFTTVSTLNESTVRKFPL